MILRDEVPVALQSGVRHDHAGPDIASRDAATGGDSARNHLAEDDEARLLGVMGVQHKDDVALVRHAYVARTAQRGGVGSALLRHVTAGLDRPILIGTWATATWAIDFYRRNGFTLVTGAEKDRLLRTYWSIPERQVETSVVLADRRWMERARRGA